MPTIVIDCGINIIFVEASGFADSLVESAGDSAVSGALHQATSKSAVLEADIPSPAMPAAMLPPCSYSTPN
jgi:hypothetical protein